MSATHGNLFRRSNPVFGVDVLSQKADVTREGARDLPREDVGFFVRLLPDFGTPTYKSPRQVRAPDATNGTSAAHENVAGEDGRHAQCPIQHWEILAAL